MTNSVSINGVIESGVYDLRGWTTPAREYARYTHQGEPNRIQTDESFLWMIDKLKLRGLTPDLSAYVLEIQAENATTTDMYIPLLNETNSSPDSLESAYTRQ